MARLDVDPDLERLGEALRASTIIDLAREKQPARAPFARRRRPRRRVLAGGTIGLAAVGAAVLLAVSAAETPAAFAITRKGDGSVLVKINRLQSLPDANRKLTAMGIHERVTIYMATGHAAVSGPVTCTRAPGAKPSAPLLKVLVGKDGTYGIGPGQTRGVIGVGTYHLDHCVATR